jgi:hypothetical protein
MRLKGKLVEIFEREFVWNTTNKKGEYQSVPLTTITVAVEIEPTKKGKEYYKSIDSDFSCVVAFEYTANNFKKTGQHINNDSFYLYLYEIYQDSRKNTYERVIVEVDFWCRSKKGKDDKYYTSLQINDIKILSKGDGFVDEQNDDAYADDVVAKIGEFPRQDDNEDLPF